MPQCGGFRHPRARALLIALDKQGNIATPFKTTGMLTGAVRSGGENQDVGREQEREAGGCPGAMNGGLSIHPSRSSDSSDSKASSTSG